MSVGNLRSLESSSSSEINNDAVDAVDDGVTVLAMGTEGGGAGRRCCSVEEELVLDESDAMDEGLDLTVVDEEGDGDEGASNGFVLCAPLIAQKVLKIIY